MISRISFQSWPLGVFLAAALLSSCDRSKKDDKADDPVAITVGSREVRLGEVQAELDDLAERRIPIATNPESFLPTAIDHMVALEQARALGIDKDPGLRRQWENLVIGRLRESEIEARLREIEVTDEEVEEFFNRNQSTYGRPAQLHLALMFLSVPSHADDAARQATRARMVEARGLALELPEDVPGFGGLAMTYSEEATSRFKGGDTGWLEAGKSAYRWPEEVVKAGFDLEEVGSISDVIDTPAGFYLLKKLDFRAPAIRSLEGRLRSSIANAILNEKRASVEQELKQSWQKAHPVTAHEDVLKKLKFNTRSSSSDSNEL